MKKKDEEGKGMKDMYELKNSMWVREDGRLRISMSEGRSESRIHGEWGKKWGRTAYRISESRITEEKILYRAGPSTII